MLVSESRNGGFDCKAAIFRDAMIVLLQLPKGSETMERYLSGDHEQFASMYVENPHGAPSQQGHA